MRNTRIAMIVLALMPALPADTQIRNVAVASAARFELGLPAPGSLASVFCTGLQGLPPLAKASGFPMPRELAGVRITIGGVPAPLDSVAELGGYQQVNLQVPLEIPSADLVEIVIQQGALRTAVLVPRLASSPGEFFLQADGQPAIQHSDFGFVSASRPARAGETLVAYLTGLRTTTTVVPTDEAAPFHPLAVIPQIQESTIADYYRLRVGTVAVNPTFIGLAPGLAGVYQVNFTLPSDLPEAPLEVQLFRYLCTADFGSCLAGGGQRLALASQYIVIPVRK